MTELPGELSIGQHLNRGGALLCAVSESPRLEAEILLCKALGKPRSFLHTWPERTLTNAEVIRFEDLLKRRLDGEPVAYITGIREFWSMQLQVSPHVLIPRQETELLVEKALQRLPSDAPTRVLDLASGSGAVALAIARERPRAQVTGLDISAPALELARANAETHSLNNVEFRHSNWFSAVRGERFDVIVANPPYVASDDPHLTQGDVRFEPRLALEAGVAGMACFSIILADACHHMVRHGWLLLEHGADQHEPLRRLMETRNYRDITRHKDAMGHDRVTECRAQNIGGCALRTGLAGTKDTP